MADIENQDFEEIAVIGMAGRFPGADSIDKFWENLVKGKCSIRQYSEEDYKKAGFSEEEYHKANLVPALGALDNAESFDESFFSYSPNEAKTIDPQQRIFLEVVYQALRDAVIDPFTYPGLVGVFAGAGYNYANALELLNTNHALIEHVGIQNFIGNEKDFLATRVAYKLNLRGPSYTLQSACSTSLLAIHQGVQNLLTYQCDAAVCGGVSLQQPKIPGYLYKEGEIFSPDGVVRTFDEAANGTVLGEGCGVVVLKRLSEAVKENNNIYAVIKASAANNDGSNKAGYTAPSVQGQRDVIRYAQDLADISPSDISFIETHGTGTSLGDVIEFSALKEVFASAANGRSCALGAVKPNVGHLDVAAGVTGFIKTCLALKNRKIPGQINIQKINSQFDIENSPFYIPVETVDWPTSSPNSRKAGVSSFGIGGTNVHLILEEYCEGGALTVNTRPVFIPVAAHTLQPLKEMTDSLTEAVNFGGAGTADVLTTLFPFAEYGDYRSGLVCSGGRAKTLFTEGMEPFKKKKHKNTVVLFPGQGTQYFGMGKEIYRENSVFRASFDTIAELVLKRHSLDIREIIFNSGEVSGKNLDSTSLTQISLFSVEYALYQVLLSLGVQPTHLSGHSLGEITAAAVSGVFTLEDAVDFIVIRGRCMEDGPDGGMIAVLAPAETALGYCGASVFPAVENGPGQSVLSCSKDSLDSLVDRLKYDGVRFVLLKNRVPFHTPLLEPGLEPLKEKLNSIQFGRLTLPVLSNLTGVWADESMLSAVYWLDQVTSPVKYRQNVDCLAALDDCLIIEAGPGHVLTGLCGSNKELAGAADFSSLLDSGTDADEYTGLLAAIGKLWACGTDISWKKLYGNLKTGRHIHLPPYCFKKSLYPVQRQTLSAERVVTRGRIAADAVTSDIPRTTGNRTLFEEITDVWKEVLGYDEIAPEADFFSLGGDSMSAGKVASLLIRRLSVDLEPVDIITNSTISELEQFLSMEMNFDKQESETTVLTISDTDIYDEEFLLPLPDSPKRLWFIHEYDSSSPAYNLAQTIDIKKDIQPALLQETVGLLTDRYDIFNLCIINKEGLPYLQRSGKKSDDYSFVDLSDEESPDDVCTNLIRLECAKTWTMEESPCYHFVLYKLRSDYFRLVLYIPHIITDGWSFNLFHKDIEYLYHQLEAGKSPVAKTPALEYLKFIRLGSTHISGNSDDLLGFWKDHVGENPGILQLPFDYPRPKSMHYTGDVLRFSFSPKTSAAIKQLSSDVSVSLFHLLVTLYAYVLHRYSNQEQIVIGIPDSNRTTPESREVAGFLLNTLPLTVDFTGVERLDELCHYVRSRYAQCIKHSGISLEKIIEGLDIPRYENINPLFQTMFAFQNYIDSDESSQFFQEIPDRGLSEYDLSAYLWERGGRIHGMFEYSNELFTEDTIKRIIDSFIHVADSFISDAAITLKLAHVVSGEEKKTLLSRANSHKVVFDSNRLYLDCLRAAVDKYGVKTAAGFEGRTISYADLHDHSSRLAGYLYLHGVKPKGLVAVYINRSIEMLVSVLAVLKTGCAYIPIDPHFPEDRIQLMLKDSGASHILTDSVVGKSLSKGQYEIIDVETDYEQIMAETGPLPPAAVSSEDRAYILYTSGSTGKPNGVQLSHRSLINFMHSMKKRPGIVPDDKVLALATLSFDISIFELLFPLLNGASIEIVPYETAIDPSRIIDTIKSAGITIAQATPATWQMLIQAGWKGKKGLKAVSGGEALSPDLSRELQQRGIDLWNGYGPTETTIYSSMYNLPGPDAEPLIGEPVDNTLFFILDEDRNLVPRGVPGELYIGGAGVSLGYLNRDELNEKRFLSNPFESSDGPVLYKTGDRVVDLGDGNYRYLERVDTQVKIRGFRIELGEIESVARSYSSVEGAVCLVKTFTNNDKRLILFLSSAGELDYDLFLQYLKERLPGYMVPSYFEVIDSLPMTPNGKIDRKRLPEINPGDFNSEEKQQPKTAAEWAAVKTWQNILGIEQIGLNDNFFALGGHSLLATRLIFEMNKTFKASWHLRDLFNHPTINGFLAGNSEIAADSIPLIFSVNKVTEGVPFFFVAGVYDDMYYSKHDTSAYEEDFLRYFNNIIVHIDMDLPLYGIRPRGIYRGETFNKDVQEMASDNIAAMKRLHPEGPYILGGECLGGVVAYEMVQQLKKAGDDVRVLILSDTVKTTFFFMIKYILIGYRRFLIRSIKKLLKAGFSRKGLMEFIASTIKYIPALLPLTPKNRETRRLLLGSSIYARKLIKYRPETLDSIVLLIINEVWNRKFPNLSWSTAELNNLDVRVVKGDHNTKLTTYGNMTGKIISDYVRQKN